MIIKNIIGQECKITIYNHNPNKFKDFTLNCYKNGIYCNDVYEECENVDITDDVLDYTKYILYQEKESEEGEKCKKFNSECGNWDDEIDDENKNEKCRKLDDDCYKEINKKKEMKYNLLEKSLNTNKCNLNANNADYDKFKIHLNEKKFECNEKVSEYESCYDKCIKELGNRLDGRINCCLMCNHSSYCRYK